MPRLVDLSHEIRDGMVTHPGIPAPRITTFLGHAESASRYAEGTTFEIARIDLVANTGTYVDTPAHRFPGGQDLSALALDAIADLPGRVIDRTGADGRRPAHTALLRAGIALVEHLTGLDALPASGFRFFAVPPRIDGMATFPVRAFAIVDEESG